jgi:hypothetical protein
MVMNKKIIKTLGISSVAVLALLMMTIPVFKSGVAYADTGNHNNGDEKQVHHNNNDGNNDKNHNNDNKNGHDDDKKRDNDNDRKH